MAADATSGSQPEMRRRRVRAWASRQAQLIRASPWHFVIKIAAWLAAIELCLLLFWCAQHIHEIDEWNSVQSSFESGALSVRISYPRFVGRGESGDLQVVVENVGGGTFDTVRVSLLDEGYLWFADGNECELSGLKQGTQGNATLRYTVGKALPHSVGYLDLAVFVEYSMTPITTTQSSGSQTVAPVIYGPFALSSSPRLQLSSFREVYRRFRGADGSPNGLSQLTNLVAALATLLAGVLALRGKFGEVVKWLRQQPTTRTSVVDVVPKEMHDEATSQAQKP